MAENKPIKNKSELIGNQAKPTTLSDTTKIDIDLSKALFDNIIDAGVSGGLNIGELEKFTQVSNSRDQIYQLIDTMAQDSTVSSIVRTYAEEVCEPADNGHIMWAESDDPNISKFVNYLLNVMNVDKNIYGWAYSLIKYGDIYLRLFRESDYDDGLFNKNNIDKAYSARNVLNEDLRGQLDESVFLNVHKSSDSYSYYVELNPDPSSMFELTKYGKTFGFIEVPTQTMGVGYVENYLAADSQLGTNYRMRSGDVNIYQADDYVHACLDDNNTRFPEKVEIFLNPEDYDSNKNATAYTVRRGKSLLFDSYKIWREKTLLESAALLNRITKSSIVRTVQVEVGDMPKEQVKLTLRRVKELMEQKSAINTGTSLNEYANAGPVENNVYLATHEGKGAVTIGQLGGDVEVKNLADLDWWNNKFYSSYGIPKQYFGWCLKFDTPILLLDGTTHTIEELYNDRTKYIGKGIMGCNKDGSLCPTKIKNILLTNPAANYMRIWLDNNKYVDVTPDHKMMLRDGSFVEAKNIKIGDSLMPYYDKIKNGRRLVLDNKLGKYVQQYHVVSAANNAPVEVGYNIHHKDRNKLNDDFTNLIKLSTADHCKEHNFDLATMHKAANQKRKNANSKINANVGGHYITNGIYYTTIKADEALPDGFWFEGPKKSDETKSKMRAARLQVLADHPEYKNLGGFKAGEASEETINRMKAGQAAYWASMTDEEKSARRELSRANGKATVGTMQAARMAKLQAEKPDAIRTPKKLRCPVCDSIFELNLNNNEYANYLQLNKLYFCCPEHRMTLDAGGKLARSYALYLKSNCDESEYEKNRLSGEARPDTFLKYSTLQTRLDTLNAYVPEVNHKVVKIEFFDDLVPVYDITVEDDCHTFALPCGIFVHNCDDGAGFNGGTSLTILSSVFAKGVKRVQNALIQAVSDIINLIFINKGYRSYLNNFTLKMRAPITQEEVDYRNGLTNKINALSSLLSLFNDVEDKERRLEILKTLVSTLDYGDNLTEEIQKEIESARKAVAEAEAAKKAEANDSSATDTNNQTNSQDEEAINSDLVPSDLDLGNSSITDEGTQESLFDNTISEKEILMEDAFLDENVALPTPEELSEKIDFTRNE